MIYYSVSLMIDEESNIMTLYTHDCYDTYDDGTNCEGGKEIIQVSLTEEQVKKIKEMEFSR